MDGGDLGLGRGWKPGALPRDESEEEAIRISNAKKNAQQVKWANDQARFNNMSNHSEHIISGKLHFSKSNDDVLNSDNTAPNSEHTGNGHVSNTNSKDTSDDVSLHSIDSNNQVTPDTSNTSRESSENQLAVVTTDVPIGTSLRQQKQLYEYNVKELFAYTYPDENDQILDKKETKPNEFIDNSSVKLDAKVLQKKLIQAQMEVEVLKQDLEQCQKQLESKYKAITILMSQSKFTNSETQKSSKQAALTSNKLQEEINKLQFELEYKQTTLMNSQQLWSDRFDRLSQENSALMATLLAKSSEMRKLTADKMAVVRERDELVALLDIQERERYESLRPPSTEEQPYGDFSSTELAILGACQCRQQNPDPCSCSYAAANLKREVAQLKDQVTYRKNQHSESMTTIDAYRKAFDEQLNRNKHLVRQLAELTSTIMSNNNKAAKFKAAMKWLLQQLNEDIPLANGESNEPLTEKIVEEKTEQELILMLVDLVSDKNEALAHQRLAARLMADKARELEEKLSVYTDLPAAARQPGRDGM